MITESKTRIDYYCSPKIIRSIPLGFPGFRVDTCRKSDQLRTSAGENSARVFTSVTKQHMELYKVRTRSILCDVSGHVAAFYDTNVLNLVKRAPAEPRLRGSALVFDSFRFPHDRRWHLPKHMTSKRIKGPYTCTWFICVVQCCAQTGWLCPLKRIRTM